MTAPIPPQSGPITSPERLAAEDHGVPPDIQQPYDGSIPGEFASAMAAGDAWCASAAQWANSPQGDGLQGYTLDDPQAADDWPTGMAFPHQGP
jgi:hypothetical protein